MREKNELKIRTKKFLKKERTSSESVAELPTFLMVMVLFTL